MPVILIDGIVTRYVNYKENDRIISIFSAEHGRIDAKARGCRKATSPLLPACQPFVYGQFELFSSRDRFTVNQCEIKETFFPIREEYPRFAIGTAMLQFVYHAVQENEPSEQLFTLLYFALSYLAYGDMEPKDLFCCFLIRYLNAIGYRPAITTCAKCGRDIRADECIRFSAQIGGAVCSACDGCSKRISKIALEAMRRMLLLTDRDMNKVRLKPELREELFRCLTEYAVLVLDYGEKALALLTQKDEIGTTENKATEL